MQINADFSLKKQRRGAHRCARIDATKRGIQSRINRRNSTNNHK